MSENATLFGACRVYLWSSATAGCSAPWPLAPWPHVLTIDIEQGGMVITEVFPLFISAARTMPSEAASDATMIAARGCSCVSSPAPLSLRQTLDRGRDPLRIVPHLHGAYSASGG